MKSDSLLDVIEVPAQSGRAMSVDAGQVIRLIDVEGAQVADLFARARHEPDEWLSTGHTRTWTSRLFPKPGQSFLTQSYEPILEFMEDASPGFHDMFYPSCDPGLYRILGAKDGHPNCRDNFLEAAASLDWLPAVMPDPVNFFQNTPANAEGKLSVRSAETKPGDAVLLRAKMDLILVVTACSQDLARINGDRCTGLRIEIFPPTENATQPGRKG